MSVELAMPGTPKEKKVHKRKDISDKRSSKKRHRDDEQSEAQPSQQSQASSSKKQRPQPVTESTVEPPETTIAQTQRLLGDGRPPFHLEAASLYLPLSPIAQVAPLEGLCAEHMSPLILTYYPPLKGVVLSYSNVRLSEYPTASSTQPSGPVYAKAVDEYAVSFVWVTADFVLFRPRKGISIRGYVNLQTESHLALVCWNLFTASIDRKRLPKEWKWVGQDAVSNGTDSMVNGSHQGGEGCFVDSEGQKVDGLIDFRIQDFEASPATERDKGFMSIEGTLLGQEEEAQANDEERARQRDRRNDRQDNDNHRPPILALQAIAGAENGVSGAMKGSKGRSIKSKTKHSTS
ncbi:hypothetical protein B0A49_02709 [Cryomyces minteri]|uniref:DNA-directed RNA polymerase subunit n=1 Tax=Cryomyces minteri TaxID=331657 RepID=A0A4V5NGY1_9PEZI|nr:hypothetical protein B0A49_02709 [Cryomyces minteri]